jgi:poly(hydroxyalkanoate) depolymerase family esterase
MRDRGDGRVSRRAGRRMGESSRGPAGLAAVLLAAVLGLSGSAAAGTLQPVSSFGTNPGNLGMYKYVPGNVPAGAPLVVVLHGCSQSAADYYREAGWDKLANENGFVLVLPEQKSINNSSRCFNWFEPGDYTRGQGEARSIISMVDHTIANHGIDTNRIFVTGLSAGGAMTAVMMAAYPEVFAGGAIMAGIPYRCANNMTSGFSCMSGVNKTPAQWGDLVRGASSHTGPWPVLSVWHGSSDFTVKDVNMNELMEQWTNVHGIDQIADATSTVGKATRKQYKDAGGAVRVETWSISGMGHATAIDPGSAAEQCGVVGAYASDQDICSSYHAALFWGIIGNGGGNPGDPGDPGDGGGDPGDGGGDPGGHVCAEHRTNNYNQVQAGRAYTTGGYVYAVGSNDYMGLYNVFETHTLAETAPGYYVVGRCP